MCNDHSSRVEKIQTKMRELFGNDVDTNFENYRYTGIYLECPQGLPIKKQQWDDHLQVSKIPAYTRQCACGHWIKTNYWIRHKDDPSIVMVLGSACYTTFLPFKGKSCKKCSNPHNLKNAMYCGRCRVECSSCGVYHPDNENHFKCPTCSGLHQDDFTLFCEKHRNRCNIHGYYHSLDNHTCNRCLWCNKLHRQNKTQYCDNCIQYCRLHHTNHESNALHYKCPKCNLVHTNKLTHFCIDTKIYRDIGNYSAGIYLHQMFNMHEALQIRQL